MGQFEVIEALKGGEWMSVRDIRSNMGISSSNVYKQLRILVHMKMCEQRELKLQGAPGNGRRVEFKWGCEHKYG